MVHLFFFSYIIALIILLLLFVYNLLFQEGCSFLMKIIVERPLFCCDLLSKKKPGSLSNYARS